MADRALIQGAAAVAAGKAAKGMAFGQGFAAGAGNIAQKIAEGVQIREQKIADGAALASANFMTWDTNGLPPKYKEIIQKEMAAANEKLNETGKNINISGAAQKSIMDKIVRDAENKAKGYIQNINLEREVGSLNMQLEDPQIAQTISGLVDPDIHDKITKVGGSKYTLDANNNYIFEGDEKAYSFQEVQEMVQKFKNSTYDRTQVGGFRESNLKIAAQSKNQKDFEKNIDNSMKSSYILTDSKDVFQIKSQLVNVYGNEPALLEDLSPQQLYDKLKETRIEYGKSQVPKPEERKDLFSEMLTQRAEDGIENLQNYGNYVGIKYAGYPITAMGIEANPESDDFGRIKIIQRIGGENVVTYRNTDDEEFMRDMYTRKLLDQAEGKDERNKARVIANTYFDTFLEIRDEEDDTRAKDIGDKYIDDPESLTEQDKIFINSNKEREEFKKIIEDQQNLINTQKEAATTKMSKPKKESLRLNWLVKVNNGEFDKYLQDNNIPKEGAINKSTGMVKSTIVNRPDFKKAFGNKYPANTYREGSVALGKMQSEFYGKDFIKAPGGGFKKETRTEYEQRTQAEKEEVLSKVDKADRAKYFRKSAKDLSAYDQLAENDEKIPKLSAEDFESFIDTGELDNKYVNIILNNKDKFSLTLIDLIQKNFK